MSRWIFRERFGLGRYVWRRGIHEMVGSDVTQGEMYWRRERVALGQTRAVVQNTLQRMDNIMGKATSRDIRGLWIRLAKRDMLEEMVELLKYAGKRKIELEGDLYPALFEALYRREMYKDLVDMYCNLKDRADLTSPKCVSPVLLAMGQSRRIGEAEELFADMIEIGKAPKSLYVAMARAASFAEDATAVESIWQQIRSTGLELTVSDYNVKLKGHVNTANLGACEDTFREMKLKKVSLNAIHVCDRKGTEARCLTTGIQQSHVPSLLQLKPNAITYGTVLDGYVTHGSLEDVKKFRKVMQAEGAEFNIVTETNYMQAFIKAGKVKEAMDVLVAAMDRGIQPNVHSYSLLIQAYCNGGDMKSAMSLFETMKAENISPTATTYAFLIEAFSRDGSMKKCLELADEMMESNIAPTARVSRALLYVVQDPGLARMILEKMNSPKLESYVKLLKICCDKGEVKNLLSALSEMDRKGFSFQMSQKRDSIMNIILTTYAKANQLSVVKDYVASMKTVGLEPSMQASCAILAALIRADDLEAAQKLWTRLKNGPEELPQSAYVSGMNLNLKFGHQRSAERVLIAFRKKFGEKAIALYNALLSSFYATKTHYRDALMLQKEMEIRGQEPNAKTRRLLMHLCLTRKSGPRSDVFSHFTELVKRGEAKTSDYNLILGHLINRGKIGEAWDFVHSMRQTGIPPNARTLMLATMLDAPALRAEQKAEQEAMLERERMIDEEIDRLKHTYSEPNVQ